MSNFDISKPVCVFGLARSGLATIRFLKSKGVEVYAWDDNEDAQAKARDLGAMVHPIDQAMLKESSALVLAPGVPLTHPQPHAIVKMAQEAGTEIICDVELWARVYPHQITVGITGTNGKSTTTALVDHILKTCGLDVVTGGNIGTAIFDLPITDEKTICVLELSSFQLDLCPTFTPTISALLNVTPDHLDRHGTMDNYIAVKKRIFRGEGHAVVATDDEITRSIYEELKTQGNRDVHGVSQSTLSDGFIEPPSLRGVHNHQNAAVAIEIAKLCGLEEEKILKAVASFPGLVHRQFLARTIGNVDYINDSKATNAESAAKALASYDRIHWIVGGSAGADGLDGLEAFKSHIEKAYLIGETSPAFSKWMKINQINYEISGTLDQAVMQAHQHAQDTGGVVLLSPVCKSFDQYQSFEHRGDHFVELVTKLAQN